MAESSTPKRAAATVIMGSVLFLLYKLVTGARMTEYDKLRAFILQIWNDADAEARRLGWPRDLIITHAALESGAWRPKEKLSRLTSLASVHKNLYGIKTGSAWTKAGKPRVLLPTEEHMPDPDRPGKFRVVKIKDWFRVYPSWGASIRDMTRLLTSLPRYRPVDEAGKRGDFSGYFQALKDSGYSTHRQYPELLASVHEAVESVAV